MKTDMELFFAKVVVAIIGVLFFSIVGYFGGQSGQLIFLGGLVLANEVKRN